MIRRLLLLVFCLAGAALSASLDIQWHSWKSQHSKSYSGQEEEDQHRLVWYDNLKKIVEHNNANKSYTLSLNEFADLVRTIAICTIIALCHTWLVKVPAYSIAS